MNKATSYVSINEHFNSTSSQIQWLGLDRQEDRYVQYEHQKKIKMNLNPAIDARCPVLYASDLKVQFSVILFNCDLKI